VVCDCTAQDEDDALLLHGDEGGLAAMVSRLAGVEGGKPTMHRVDLVWRERPVVPFLLKNNPNKNSAAHEGSVEGESQSQPSLFASHETAELKGCGAGGKDGTAVRRLYKPNPVGPIA
jgi:hypothetical protein